MGSRGRLCLSLCLAEGRVLWLRKWASALRIVLGLDLVPRVHVAGYSPAIPRLSAALTLYCTTKKIEVDRALPNAIGIDLALELRSSQARS